jgi:ABC-type amino acid transport substrate-binding protein
MGTRRSDAAARVRSAAVLLIVLALAIVSAALLAACGGDDEPGLSGTPAERAVTVLGQDPTGLAAEVVAKGYMVVANDAAYPPRSSVDESTGELTGFDVDVAKRVGEVLGLKVRFVNPEWETVPAGLRRGRFDVSIGSMPVTPEYEKVVDFTAPYYGMPAQVVTGEAGVQIDGVDDLAGEKVGAGISTKYYDYLETETRAVARPYPSDAAAQRALRKGAVAFILTDAYTAQVAITAGQPLQTSGKPLYVDDLAFAVAPGETDWRALLDYAIAELQADGTLSDLSKKWFDGLDLAAGG